MSLAGLLIQPQLADKLGNAVSEDADAALGNDLLVLIRRLVTDTQKSAAVLEAIQIGFEQFADHLIQNASNFDDGLRQFNRLFAPLVEQLQCFSDPDESDLGGLLTLLLEKFVALTDVIKSININQVRGLVDQILGILVNQFGFSLATIVNQLWTLFDTIIIELKAIPAGTDAEQRALRLLTASMLARIKRQLEDQLVLPDLDSEEISQALMAVLREAGLEGWIQYANKIAEAMQNTFAAAGSIADLINIAEGGVSVGAAAREADSADSYCWYASWLLATRKRCPLEALGNLFILNPPDEVWVTADKTQVVWRTVFGDDVCLYEGVNVKWHQAPIFNEAAAIDGAAVLNEYVLFPHIGAETLEALARATYIVVEFGKTIFNTIDADEPGDHASAVTHLIWNTFNAVFAGIGNKPFNAYLTSASGIGQGHQGWMSAIFPVLGTLFPALEGRHTEADEDAAAFFAILLADDVLERAGHHLVLSTVRDLLLSTLTLINNAGQAQGNDNSHPINKEYTATWAAVGGTVATIIYFKAMYNKVEYSHPFNGFLGSFAGALAGLCGGLTGTLIGSAFAGINISFKDFLVDIGTETGKGFFLYYLNAYSWIEGDTDSGKFNGEKNEFAGYPEKSDSPYKLPFAAGQTKPCVQGNQGMWSHFAAGNQIYAVDFGFDQAELIVASRSGTVVDFSDQTANDTEGQWNYIVIRHDDPMEVPAVRSKHDKYHDGGEYITYGVYGHGRTNGVREVFAARSSSVAVDKIVGTTVSQGEVIMKAGNTGISFHNHLHFQVKTRLEVHETALPGDKSVGIDELEVDTIPFVYQDVDADGVVKSLTFYTSSNGVT
ncbi:MAG: M23 family metallopeptidase [Pseudomonadales bacterium]|nr:M23 family metallopeptidase [Pseudomonadales bacterium]